MHFDWSFFVVQFVISCIIIVGLEHAKRWFAAWLIKRKENKARKAAEIIHWHRDNWPGKNAHPCGDQEGECRSEPGKPEDITCPVCRKEYEAAHVIMGHP